MSAVGQAEAHASTIRPARSDEISLLTDLAVRSKAYWGYSQKWMGAFYEDLYVSERQVQCGDVFVLDDAVRVCGFYSLAALPDGDLEIGHLFVEPTELRRGYGRSLVGHACERARERGFDRLVVVSDPHAEAFYAAMGAVRVSEAESVIPGRSLPVLQFALSR